MKKIILSTSVLFALISCSNDDGYTDEHANQAKKYITKMESVIDGNTENVILNYNNNGKIVSYTDGREIGILSYDNNGELAYISGDGDQLIMDEVFSEIHDAYELGKVLRYDAKGNPIELELKDSHWEWDEVNYDYHEVIEINKAYITYDDKPYFMYNTLDAAGIIRALDKTRLNFNLNITAQDLIIAKTLLPVNNVSKIEVKDSNNRLMQKITLSYDYSSDNYPASIFMTSVADGEVEAKTINITYKN